MYKAVSVNSSRMHTLKCNVYVTGGEFRLLKKNLTALVSPWIFSSEDMQYLLPASNRAVWFTIVFWNVSASAHGLVSSSILLPIIIVTLGHGTLVCLSVLIVCGLGCYILDMVSGTTDRFSIVTDSRVIQGYY